MNEIFECPFCGRNDFKNKSGFTLHIKYCKSNPDRVEVSDETKQKLSEAGKKRYEDPEERRKTGDAGKGRKQSDETKQKISESLKGHTFSDEVRQKMSGAQKIIQNKPERKLKQSEANKGRKHTQEELQKMSEASKIVQNRPEVKQKAYNTKKKNNSFNTSKIEEQLKEWFNSQNIDYKTQHKSKQYPFMCDFYFPNKDLYVEIQGSWTHGGKPYIETDPDCVKQLETWKSKNTNYYNKAIETWTVRDPKKRETAKQNNLNWIEIFSIDLEECINIIQKHI